MSDERPLKEVFADLVVMSKQLNEHDDKIGKAIADLERKLRGLCVERVFSARLPDGADLGWSYNRRHRRWRFVIRTEDDAWDLLQCSRGERAEVFSCGAMEKVIAQALAYVKEVRCAVR